MLLEEEFSKPEIFNAQDYEGKTALAHPLSLDYLEIVRKLVDSGADPRIVNYRVSNPLTGLRVRLGWRQYISSSRPWKVQKSYHTIEHRGLAVMGLLRRTKNMHMRGSFIMRIWMLSMQGVVGGVCCTLPEDTSPTV